jgi:hypothetical protein
LKVPEAVFKEVFLNFHGLENPHTSRFSNNG